MELSDLCLLKLNAASIWGSQQAKAVRRIVCMLLSKQSAFKPCMTRSSHSSSPPKPKLLTPGPNTRIYQASQLSRAEGCSCVAACCLLCKALVFMGLSFLLQNTWRGLERIVPYFRRPVILLCINICALLHQGTQGRVCRKCKPLSRFLEWCAGGLESQRIGSLQDLSLD